MIKYQSLNNENNSLIFEVLFLFFSPDRGVGWMGGDGREMEMGRFLPQSLSSVTTPSGLANVASRNVRHVRYIYLHFNQ